VKLVKTLRERYRYSAVLLKQLVITDFKLRYQGSVLGYAWSLLRPLMFFTVLYVIFVQFLKFGGDVPHFPVYLLLGVVLWTFFADMTNQSLGSIVERGDLIRKIRIPRWTIVLSASVSAVINLGLNLLVVLLFMIINKVDLLQTSLWLPLILLEIYVIALGFSLLLAAAFVKFRDISYIWEVIMQAGFYATPILYPLAQIKNVDFQKILLLNPMAQAIQDARYTLVTHKTQTIEQVFGGSSIRLVTIGVCVVVLVAGVFYFKKEAKYFAENL
jgi:ABC-2 type transport system permease protein